MKKGCGSSCNQRLRAVQILLARQNGLAILRSMITQKLKPRVREFERTLIREAVAKYGSRTAAAAALGVTTQTIREKIGVEARPAREPKAA